jgi:hypothetical protein
MTTTHRFNVFGRIYAIRRAGTGWEAFAIGADGKRGPAGFVVPDFIEADELAQYLYDLFHEQATPTNGDVLRIG